MLSFSIVLYHASGALVQLAPPAWRGPLQTVLTLPLTRVDLFFVLSGLVLSFVYRRRWQAALTLAGAAEFWRRRLIRIYPLHLLVLLALVPAAGLAGLMSLADGEAQKFTVTGFLENLFLVQAWHLVAPLGWNGPSWWLSAEWFALLGAPVLLARLWRLPTPWVLALALLLSLLPAAGESYLAGLLPHTDRPLLPLLRGACGFYCGAALAVLLARGTGARAFRAHLSGAALTAWVLGSVALHARGMTLLWLLPVAGVALLGLAHGEGRLAPLLKRPWLTFWGERTFALYLTHYPWLLLIRAVLPPEQYAGASTATRAVLACVYLLPTLGLAAGAHSLYERPVREWLERRGSRPRRAAVVTEP